MSTPGNQQLLKAISYLANLEYVKGKDNKLSKNTYSLTAKLDMK